ncbi:TetR/AcrR family transcriptional regulator [Paenibacillus glufosinatiresistens]|uniref:TetR/AcrR family transcriptional regulator n=1 Tax=Paenibacillus glufosinatiresistens TaxID=3070657 RepID=UPI00286DAC1A|nr:TetR/AcrR family transcriptional regulator [Paenibacillus sp. YX.27]
MNTSGKVDPRVLRTRRLLKQAFFELLQEREVDKITVNQLAERATINRVTFYLHYRDVPDLMDRIADEMIREISGILSVDNPDPEQRNSPGGRRERLLKLLEHIADNSKFYKSVLATRRISVFAERLLDLISNLILGEIQRQEQLQPDGSSMQIQKDIAIWYGSSALMGVIIKWLQNDMPYSPAYLARQFAMLTYRN